MRPWFKNAALEKNHLFN